MDVSLYPVLRHAYEVDPRTEMEKLAGHEAVVRAALEPRGGPRPTPSRRFWPRPDGDDL